MTLFDILCNKFNPFFNKSVIIHFNLLVGDVMKYIKRLLIIGIILLFGFFIFNDYNNNSLGINIIFDKLLASADDEELLDIKGLGNLVSDKDTKSLKDSGINGRDISVNTKYYPYYGMLNDEERAIYKQIYANVNAFESTFVPVTDIDEKNLKNSIMAVFYDHPELFWLDNDYSYKYTSSGKCVQIIMKFNSTINNIDEAKKEFDSEAKRIIDGASRYNSTYEKEKYVHNAIITNTSYDSKIDLNQSAYSALVNKRSVCAGYSRAFQYIMIKLGIPTYYVVGIAEGNHAWNIVALSDGYYNVDVTWDDQDRIIYNFFNRTDKDFSKSHVRSDLSVNLPSCNATGYSIKNVVKNVVRNYKKTVSNDTKASNTTVINNNTEINSGATQEEKEVENNANEIVIDSENIEIVKNENVLEDENIGEEDNEKNSDE